MTVQEFSNEFDTLLNSYSNSPTYGKENKLDIVLDEYEKSIFLTKAQDEIVIELYSGKNTVGDTFEGTEEIRRYLADLIKTIKLTNKLTEYIGVTNNSILFKLPEDVWFITYESVILEDENLGCYNGREVIVVPIAIDEFYRISNNPFKGPSKSRVIRLDIENNVVELVSDYNIKEYTVRYLSKPKPIILTDLNDLSVNGIHTVSECELNSAIHRAILERAIKLAIISKTQVSTK